MMARATTKQAALQGRRILVVEDEYIIAEEITGRSRTPVLSRSAPFRASAMPCTS